MTNNSDVIYVHAHTKDDGTKVKAHYRSKPDGVGNNNYQNDGVTTGGTSNIKKFTTNQIGIGFTQDKNLNYSIGHGTILNPKIENGVFRGILFDKYDYNLHIKDYL